MGRKKASDVFDWAVHLLHKISWACTHARLCSAHRAGQNTEAGSPGTDIGAVSVLEMLGLWLP